MPSEDSQPSASLHCKCPVCQRIEGLIENARLAQDVSQGVHLGVSKGVVGRPQKGARKRKPNSEQAMPVESAENIWSRFPGGSDDEENDATDAKGRRMYIVGLDGWTADGRFL